MNSQIETPATILQYSKKIGKYCGMSSFFVFQIFTSIMVGLGANDFLIGLYANPYAHILMVLALIEWGYFSADRIITEYLKRNENLDTWSLFAIPFFVKMVLITDIIYFEIAGWTAFEAYIGNEEKRVLLHHYLIQAQIFGPFSLFSTAIFFYGKDIWRNIRKRDLILH